jgi:hypothetical protein
MRDIDHPNPPPRKHMKYARPERERRFLRAAAFGLALAAR